MNALKWVILTWIASLAVLFGINTDKETHAHSFCAYSRVFVEFEEDGKKWGTLMLDYEGKPIPCSEYYNNKEIAIPRHIDTKERKKYDQSV